MDIELKRAFTPEEIGEEEECGICGRGFVTEVVTAYVLHHDLNCVCPPCVEYLGRRNPERFPSIEEYEEANRRYREPMYPSEEEVMRLEDAEDPSLHEANERCWISRQTA